MKRIDASPIGIFDITWSADGKWLAYVAGEDEVRIANIETGEIRIIGSGCSPHITDDQKVVLERNSEVVIITKSGEKTLLTKKDIVKDTPKQGPVLSPDSRLILVGVLNVFDKVSQAQNAYAYRHFIAITPTKSSKATLTNEQWYGGAATWFPDSKRFVHFEFDSTGGPQVHIVSAKGEREGTVAGLYPSVSPDGTRIAARPKGGGSLVVYSTKGAWNDEEIETAVLRIPGGGQARSSATAPIWLDNRFVLVAESGRLWRMDTKRDKADEMKKVPMPTERRKYSMIASPIRDMLAAEIAADDGFDLRVISLT
jgi:Tol biopolymer transport system component